MATPYWCVVTVDELPEGIDDGVLLSDGIPEGKASSSGGQDLQYSLMCRTIADDDEDAHNQAKQAVRALGTEAAADVWTLSTEISHMIRSERRIVQAMTVGDVSVHGRFLAFTRGNISALERSRNIIALSVSRRRWQIWR